ncbi:uncharacterized protein LOC132194538 isoform X2 [Neocloeon triangulifer]|uniref:uncharacterized protein LOC132194538 isoform X2 n=1 Tax=Neocloeon triangulifer TaxID=2078957 RepID=UPI00286F2651|nr:uncharacterized protein LOC132194538 isoform X2 [Neocloeon triangulifer]
MSRPLRQHHLRPPATIDATLTAVPPPPRLNHVNHFQRRPACLRNNHFKPVPFELVNHDLEEQDIASCCHQCCCVPLKAESYLDTAVNILWFLTPLTATIAMILVAIAMTTNQWLNTEEKMPNSNYNGTGERNYLSKYTVSGLWSLCYTNHAITKSAVFFIVSSILLVLAVIFCLAGHLARHKRIFTFLSGLIFIISGLLMLTGLVMYISVFKAEIGSKLRPRSQLQPPMFTYSYGLSFLLVVLGFVATEGAGTCAVFLYIYWHQRDWRHKSHARPPPAMPPPPPHGVPPPPSPPYCQRHLRPILMRRCSYGSGSPPPPLPHHVPPPTVPPLPPHYLPEEDEGECSGSCTASPDSEVSLRCRSQGTLTAIHRDHGGDGLVRDACPCLSMEPISRENTCNTVSTTADINCDFGQHEFVSFEPPAPPPPLHHQTPARSDIALDTIEYPNYGTLRKTTPV